VVFGDIDIFIKYASSSSKKKKMSCSHGEWKIAYASAKKSFSWHTHTDLRNLMSTKGIIGLFTAAAIPEKNLLVIQLNWAICLFIAHSNISFTSYHMYSDLITHHLIMGIQNGPSNQPGSSSK